MITTLTPPASHVVAAQFEGEITKSDVVETIGLVESALEASPRVNLFFDLTRLEGMTATAILNDLAYGLKSLGRLYRFQQIAVVTDSQRMEKLVSWEAWLFKSIEVKSFPSAEREQALAWVERRVEVPEPGFTDQSSETHLAIQVGKELSGYDITRVADLIRERYEETGPVRLLVAMDEFPKLGPGFTYEKLRRFKLLNLIARYAVVGPESLRTKVAALNPVTDIPIKHFLSEQREAAEAWLHDPSPKVEVLTTDREDRFALRLSGKITSEEIQTAYATLIPYLRGDNSLDVMLEIPYEDGITFKALFQAVHLGIKHFSKLTQGIRRLAIITDSRFLSKATELENLLVNSIEERPFTFSQRDIALAWLSEGREEVPALTTQLPQAEPTQLLQEAE